MLGLVVVTHGNLGETMLETAQTITGIHAERVALVEVSWNDPMDEIESKVREAIQKVMTDQGVIIVTDMFGGTPSNVSLAFVGEGPIAVVTGVNLPMFMVFLNHQDSMDYTEMARHMKKRGVDSIMSSLDVLPDLHLVDKES